MSFKKKVTLTIMMVVSILCLVFGAVACNGESAKDAIEKYILPQNESLVDADFTLPKTIGKDVKVTWNSSHPEIIAIEDSGDKYTAKVTLPDEVTPVTLTISAGGHSKDFTVRVDEFSVYTFIKNYKFAQKNTAVKKDFDLETETTIQGKTAKIEWSIEEKYQDWINLNAEKNRVLVTPAEEVKSVEIAAKFIYGEKDATQKYPFSVTPKLDHRQIVKNMYSEEDYALELSGYIVHVYQAKIDEKYGPEATFYMIDDDFCSGYYLYNVEIQEDQVDKFVEGAHVTVTGATGTNYNGLWENKSNSGLAVIDTTHDPVTIDPREKVYAIDTDLLAGAPSLLWHESTFVSLTGWKVDSLGSAKPKEGTTGTLFTLKKGDATVAVTYSKYIKFAEGEAAKVIGLYDTIKVGDFVNVMGILGNYKGFQIQPVLASDVTKATAESTNTDGAKVKTAIGKVNEAVEANFSSLIAADKEVTMPASEQGVSITYEVAGVSNPTVKIEGGKFTISPTSVEHNYDILVTYTIGDYTAYDFFKLHNWKLSDTEIVKNVKEALEEETIADINRTGEFDLPAVDDLGATITWKVEDTSLSWISVADGKIKVASLPSEDTEVTLVATIVLNSATETVELKVKVAAASAFTFKAIEEPAAGTYKLAMDKNGTMLYFSGEMDGFYYGTVTEAENAADVVLAGSTSEGWTLKTGNKFLEIEYAKGTDGNMHANVKLMDAQTAGKTWTWDATNKVFTWTVDVEGASRTYFLGTDSSKNYTTISANTIDKISSYCVAKLGEMVAAELTFKAIEEPAAGTYKLAMDKNGTMLYFSGEMDGFYYGTVTEAENAADVVLAGSTSEGWTLKTGNKFLEIEYAKGTDGYMHANVKLMDAQTAGKTWTWDATNKVFTWTVDVEGASKTYFLGTDSSKNYTTISANTIDKISSYCVAKLGTMEVGAPGTTEPEPEEPTLPEGGTQDDPYTVAEAIEIINELADKGYYGDPVKEVYVKGVVVKASSLNSFTIGATKDATETVTVYGATLNTEGTFTKAGDLVAGAEITVSGALYKYGTTSEIASTGNIKVKVVSYTDPRTDAEKATAAKDAVLMPKRVDENFELPAANVTGVTFEWAIAENSAAKLSSDSEAVEVTRGAADVEFTLTLTVKCGSETQTKTYTITVKGVLAAGEHTATLDFTSDFKTYYAADWTNSYTEHVIKMADVSDSGIKGTVTLSNASKQTSTITDRPTMAAKNSVTAYVTVYADGAPLTSVTFTLKQWTAKKKFSKIFIETSTDGSEWTAYGTPVGDGASNTVVITDSGNEANNVFTFTATDETVKYVRLSIQATGKDNVQVGLTSVALTVKIPAAAAATSVAPVALLPGKEF